MRVLDKELDNRKIVFEKLIDYGFIKKDNSYIYEYNLLDGEFKMIVDVDDTSKMTSKVLDTITNEDYLLVDISSSSGEFVGKIKEEYESKLQNIIDECTVFDVFKSDYAKLVIQYVKDKYGDELEYLWKKFPKNAVFRHKENKKWYGALLVLSKRKLGLDDDTIVDIIDLRNTKEEIKRLVDNKKFFAGYHMNKEHWFTIILDGSVPIEEIFNYIDISHDIQ